jgi:hypothetical protein
VRIGEGPFANFTGVVEEVNADRSTLKVSVTILAGPRRWSWISRRLKKSPKAARWARDEVEDRISRGLRMAKKVQSMVKLQLPATKATPAPPVGTALGPHGVNIMDFVQAVQCQDCQRTGWHDYSRAGDDL